MAHFAAHHCVRKIHLRILIRHCVRVRVRMRFCVLVLAMSFAAHAAAQTVPDAVVSPPPTPLVVAPPLPLVPAATQLKGRALVEALRRGGYVLYMRHALQMPATSDKCDAPSLRPEGEQQARTVGAALRELKIPVGRLRSSQVCRVRETAKMLGLGNYEITEDLNPAGAREGFDVGPARSRQLAELPPAGSNTLLVSHLHGSPDKAEWMHLELAEIIVFRPDGSHALPVARVRVEGWQELESLMKAERP